MSYLGLHNTDGTTDLVDPVVALNNNWDTIDSKIKALDTGADPVGTGIVSPETSLECVSSQAAIPDVGVYDGAAWQNIKSSDTWGAWQNINLQANFNAVAGRTPQLRLSDTGRVQMRGAVQYLAGSTAWPSGYQLIHNGQFPYLQYSPAITCIRTLMATPTHSTTWSYGQLFLSDDLTYMRFWICYVGTTLAAGNYVVLDDAEWWVQ